MYVGADAPGKDIPNNEYRTHSKHVTGCFASSTKDWMHLLRTGALAAVIDLRPGCGIDAALSARLFLC